MQMDESDSDPCETEPLVIHTPTETGTRPKSKASTGSHIKATQKDLLQAKKNNPSRKSKEDKSSHGTLQPLREENVSSQRNEHDKIVTANSDEFQGNEPRSASMFCPIFGVRNYLNQFYERTEVKNVSIYEDMPAITDDREAIYLVKRKEGLCSSSVFRLSMMLGGLILLLGTIAFIVAACASRRALLVGKVGGISVVDRVAASHNAEVDALLLVGLVALTLGATVVASSLISRAFCRRPEEEPYGETILPGYASIYDYPPFLRPIDKKVPATEEITKIQPWTSSAHTHIKNTEID